MATIGQAGPASIYLDDNAQARFHGFKPAVLDDVLSEVLGKPSQTYTAQFDAENGQDHLLLETHGHVLHLKQSPTSVLALRSSQPTVTGNLHGVQLSLHNTDSCVVKTPTAAQELKLIGRAHEGLLSGAHRALDGDALRLHQGQLYAFDQAGNSWRTKPIAAQLSQIATQGNGKLFGQAGDALYDLSRPTRPRVEVPGLKAFSVNAHNHLITLSGEDNQTLQLFDLHHRSVRPSVSKQLSLYGGEATPKSIGFSPERVFVCDTEGRLYSATYDQLNSACPVLALMPEQHFHPSGERWGAEQHVTDFLSEDNGEVSVVARDAQGQIHTHGLDEKNQRLLQGWNLSNVLVINNDKGIAERPPLVTSFDTFDLAGLGRIGISGDQIKIWDDRAQQWADTNTGSVQGVQRGMNGNLYALQDGVARQLDINHKNEPRPFGTGLALTPPSSTAEITLGKALAGQNGIPQKGFAVLNDQQYVLLDEQGVLKAFHKDGQVTELKPIGQEIACLALDESHNLCALSTAGELYVMNARDWQASSPNSTGHWSPIASPDSSPLQKIRTSDINTLAVSNGNQQSDAPHMHISNGRWRALPLQSADHNAVDALFARLQGAQQIKRVPGTHLSCQVTGKFLERGITGAEIMSTKTEYLKAHVFKPTLEPPRFLKNIVHNIQHRHQGRDGLEALYAEQGAVLQRLNNLGQTPPAPGTLDLESRIARLPASSPQSAAIKKELEDFRRQLEESAHRTARQLGEHYLAAPPKKQSSPAATPPPPFTRDQFLQKSEGASTAHDLLKEAQRGLAHAVPSQQNPTASVIQALREKGVLISHQQDQLSMGQRRDRSDKQALTKARLALDINTLSDLEHLIATAETQVPEEALGQLRKALKHVRDDSYGASLVKLTSDSGFTSYRQLEAYYDSVKSFAKGFGKTDHATYTNYRAGTGSKDQEETAAQLSAQLRQLKPGESIDFQRGYGGSLSTPFLSLPNTAIGPFPDASVNANRAFRMSASGAEKGVIISFNRDFGASVSAGLSVGANMLNSLLNTTDVSTTVGNHQLTPQLRLAADLRGTVSATNNLGMSFTLPDEEIGKFVQDLFSSRLSPLELLKRVSEHRTSSGRNYAFDLDASAVAQARGVLGLTEIDNTPNAAAAPWAALVRAGVGTAISANLLNYTKQSAQSHGKDGDTVMSSQNRLRGLNSATATAGPRIDLAASHVSEQGDTEPDMLLGIGMSAAVTNATSKNLTLTFTASEAVSQSDIEKLLNMLTKAFPAPNTRQALSKVQADIKGHLSTTESLAALNSHFEHQLVNNDEQYTAMRALKRATVQQNASVKQQSLLQRCEFESNYSNPGRIDHQSLVSKVMSLVNARHSPSNAERISDLLDKDPTLTAVLKQLQATPGTAAKVKMELKDSVRDQIETASRHEILSQPELIKLLNDRNNFRIKSITVAQTASKLERFASPLPVVGGGSNAMLGVTKTLGAIDFIYGRNEDAPSHYTLTGEQNKATSLQRTLANALVMNDLALKH